MGRGKFLTPPKEKMSHFDQKSRVTGGTKIRIGIPSKYLSILRVNSNRLSIASQFDSNILESLGIQGRILVPPVTQLFRSKWLQFIFQWYLRCFVFRTVKARGDESHETLFSQWQGNHSQKKTFTLLVTYTHTINCHSEVPIPCL